MSRAIQIRVSESVVRTVHVEDGVQSPLELLPILAPERMAELLAAELAAQGFIRDGDTMTRSDPDGIEISVDLKAATVTAKIGAETEIAESIDRKASVGIERKEAQEEALRRDIQRELETRVAERAEALRREITDRLERKLADLRSELDRAIGRATVNALTEKAAQLGHIESVVEDQGGNVTIRVKL